MNKVKLSLLFVLAAAVAMGCSSSPDQLKKTLEDHPDILVNAIEKHPELIFPAIQKAAQKSQKVMQEQAEKDEAGRVDTELAHPLTPVMADDRAYRGDKGAPITIVEYSDFQCPYCKKGFETMEEVEKEYNGKVRFLFKNMPLPFHPLAMPAAKRFEAIVLQSPEKAYKYHDTVFSNQDKLNAGGEKYLDSVAKGLGVNMAQMKKDMDSDKVNSRIQGDIEEAKKYDITGTPGFIVNGVSIRGAYPFPTFKEVIEKTLAKKGKS
jgi:protein-disulfide isomerase